MFELRKVLYYGNELSPFTFEKYIFARDKADAIALAGVEFVHTVGKCSYDIFECEENVKKLANKLKNEVRHCCMKLMSLASIARKDVFTDNEVFDKDSIDHTLTFLRNYKSYDEQLLMTMSIDAIKRMSQLLFAQDNVKEKV